MTLTTLAIHTEAWLQEELGAQRTLLSALEAFEGAARAGSRAELERRGQELEGLLLLAGPREAHRRALLERLAAALALPTGEIKLSKLAARLSDAHIETHRLEGLRTELRGVVAAVVKAGRRLTGLARYHGGVLEELCQLLLADPTARGGHLVDARG